MCINEIQIGDTLLINYKSKYVVISKQENIIILDNGTILYFVSDNTHRTNNKFYWKRTIGEQNIKSVNVEIID